MLKTIHIIGLGLMGTNLGIKLVNSGFEVSGSDVLEKNVRRAKELSAISLDHEESIEYDLTVLATPINEILNYFDSEPSLKSRAIVDLGGTKELICKKMDTSTIPAIGGHPLCGIADNSTWEPTPEMYEGAPFLLCETRSTDEQSKVLVSEFIKAIESSEVWIDQSKHDELISLTSHLPHILSSALVSLAMKEQDLNELINLASGGFDGATRLSRTSPNMISDMYLTNVDNVKDLINKLISELQQIQKISDEKIMLGYLSDTVDWRRALAEKFGERDLT